jgi:hypothetical protein
MATIKIYDSNDNSIEIFNNGNSENDIVDILMTHNEAKDNLFFYLSKSDAIELIKFLKKEFRITDIQI